MLVCARCERRSEAKAHVRERVAGYLMNQSSELGDGEVREWRGLAEVRRVRVPLTTILPGYALDVHPSPTDLEARLQRLERRLRRRDAIVAALAATIVLLACRHDDTAPPTMTSLAIGNVSIDKSGITIKDGGNTLGLYADHLTIDSGERHAMFRGESLSVATGGSESRLSAGPAALVMRASEHDRLLLMADTSQASIHGEVAHGEHFGAVASAVDQQAVVLAASTQKAASIYAKGADANTSYEPVK